MQFGTTRNYSEIFCWAAVFQRKYGFSLDHHSKSGKAAQCGVSFYAGLHLLQVPCVEVLVTLG